MAYNAYVTTIKELRKHENADRLQVATVFGNDVVVGLDLQVGDVVIYFPTDGRLSEEYATKNNLVRIKGSNSGGYLDPEKRNVSTIRLRGEKSDGLIMPLSSLDSFCNTSKFKDGDTITTVNGHLICEKYVPKSKVPKVHNGKTVVKPKENNYPLFQQHIDTAQLAYNLNSFKEGDLCHITLKLHGTSQRTSHTVKKTKPTLLQKLFRWKPAKTWEYISGTRRVTLENFDGGFYGGNEFRKKWHDFFEGKLHKGESIFYETVGYTGKDQLIMAECENKKTQDKEFIKTYGKRTQFTYGCENGESDIYVYRMTMTNEDGTVVEYPHHLVQLRCEQMGVKVVPTFESFIFTTKEDLMDRVKKYEEGVDPIGKTHIREGVIVRIENREKFTALKQKNFHFKVLESIIKLDDVLDMEERESSHGEI